MNGDKLVRLEKIFRTFIMPLMDENGTNDYGFIWEFEKYLDSKKEEISEAEKQAVRIWEAPLRSR